MVKVNHPRIFFKKDIDLHLSFQGQMKILNILGLYNNDTPSYDLTLHFQMLQNIGQQISQ
jgi:hypothetical protein